MPSKPTGRPTGRPKTKEYEMITARVPSDLAALVKRYAAVHRQSMSELIRDGLVWRIEQDTPGRLVRVAMGIPMASDDSPMPENGDTVLQEVFPMLHEAIAAAVREAIHPVIGLLLAAHQEPVIQQPIPLLQQDTGDRKNGAEAPASSSGQALEAKSYDASKFYLGKLCPKGHEYEGSGLSLLRKHHGGCRECENQAKREKRARQKAAQEG